MLHRLPTYLLVVPALAVAPLAAPAQRLERTPEHPTPEQVEAQLHYQTSHVTLRRGLATLDLPVDFRYLDPQATDVVLRAWGNPPGSETLGMLVPAGVRVLAPEGWGVIIGFTEDGYVKDDHAAKIASPTSSTGRRTSSSRTTRRTPSITIFASWAGAASSCSTPWHRWIGSSRSAGTWRR